MILRRALTLRSLCTAHYSTFNRDFDSSMAHWSATCLSSETSDTNLSILIDCNASRYMFNCGEGTTRTLLQRKKGFRKFKAIFMSAIDTNRSGGLPGLIMTMADSGTSKVDVFGPPGLNHFLASTRLYTMRETLSLKTHELSDPSPSPVYADENISVYSVPVLPSDDTPSDDTSTTKNQGPSKRKRTSDCDFPLPASKRERIASEGALGGTDAVCLDDSFSKTLNSSVWESSVFDPSNLTGKKADLWRQLVVQNMFPGKAPSVSKHVASAVTDTTGPPSAGPSGRAKDVIKMAQFNKRLPSIIREPYAISYILLGALGRGKFDATKAAALGLKPGPARGRLAKGETVVTPEGNTITPDMVLGTPPRPDAMVVIDCPSANYIPGLARSNEFKRFQIGGEYPVHCMLHLVGSDVLEDVRYREWLKTFGGSVHHLVAGIGITPDRITFTSSAYAQLRLSHLDSAIFRVPRVSAPSSKPFEDGMLLPNMEVLRHNHFIAMKPAKTPVLPSDDDGIDLFHPALQRGGEHNVACLLQPKTIDVFRQARGLVTEENHQRDQGDQPGDNVVVTPLGTSSAMPSKYRNVSSLIVQIPDSGSILLDCGEGTLGQIRRHFGEEAPSVLRDIRCIFISHIHGDHHMGLSKLLSQRRKLEPPCTSPVYLITNQPTFMYLQEYNNLENLGLDDSPTGVRVIYSEHAHWRRRPVPATNNLHDTDHESKKAESSQSAIRDLKSALNLASIVTVDVWHRGRCYGIVIKHLEGWSVVYSGDTRPTENLVRAGRDATLLIHEATLGDDQAEIAAQKAHSTIGQAIDVARRMQAKNVLLTHFSNRFPKTPQMTNGPTNDTDPVIAIAFDHASVSIRDLWKLNRYLPAVEQSFIDSDDPEDEVVEAVANAP